MRQFLASYRNLLSALLVIVLFSIAPGAAAQRVGEPENQPRPSMAVERCSSIIIGKQATKDGSVILAHNEDLANYSAHHYVYIPPATHGPGEVVTTWGERKFPR